MNPKITLTHVMNAVKKDDGIGICKVCGKSQKYCEPDARNCTCNHCGAAEVFGAEELLMEMA